MHLLDIFKRKSQAVVIQKNVEVLRRDDLYAPLLIVQDAVKDIGPNALLAKDYAEKSFISTQSILARLEAIDSRLSRIESVARPKKVQDIVESDLDRFNRILKEHPELTPSEVWGRVHRDV